MFTTVIDSKYFLYPIKEVMKTRHFYTAVYLITVADHFCVKCFFTNSISKVPQTLVCLCTHQKPAKVLLTT